LKKLLGNGAGIGNGGKTGVDRQWGSE